MSIKAKVVLENLTGPELKKLFDKLKTLDKDQRYRVFVLDAKKLRSGNANRYYWGVVIGAISDHTGIDPMQMHEMMKKRFNLQTVLLGSTMEEFSGSTKLLNTKEFAAYVDQIRIWANVELDCRIPDAGEMDDETLIELMNRGL